MTDLLKSDDKTLKKIGPDEIRSLASFFPDSHKGQNGILTIVAGSPRYHGALVFAVGSAAKFVDLIYVVSNELNDPVIKELKLKTAEFISAKAVDLNSLACRADTFLIGPGLDRNDRRSQKLATLALKHARRKDKKVILDADAFYYFTPDVLSAKMLLTPHQREFEVFFGLKASIENVTHLAKQFGCTILLKGRTDLICSAHGCRANATGNAGMSKGGSGDVLAGLAAALSCSNDLFLAAQAAAFLNGSAGDSLYERFATAYSAADLIEEIPRVFKRCLEL